MSNLRKSPHKNAASLLEQEAKIITTAKSIGRNTLITHGRCPSWLAELYLDERIADIYGFRSAMDAMIQATVERKGFDLSTENYEIVEISGVLSLHIRRA